MQTCSSSPPFVASSHGVEFVLTMTLVLAGAGLLVLAGRRPLPASA